MLTESELTRYHRQIIVPGWGQGGQEKLKQATVFVAGAGGLGSPLTTYLAVAGVGTITVCDNDTVELSNLNRQILHNEKRIGMAKVESAAETLHVANPHTRIVTVPSELTRENVTDLVGEVNLLIDCLDNFTTRHILNELSVDRQIPMIHAGVSEFLGQMTFLHPPDTPCLWCLFPMEPKPEIFPIVGCTPGVIGTLQATEAIKFITGVGTVLKNRLLFWDGYNMQFDISEVKKNPDCPVCGTAEKP